MFPRPSHQQRCLPFKKESVTTWYSAETVLIRILEDSPLLSASQKASSASAAVMMNSTGAVSARMRRASGGGGGGGSEGGVGWGGTYQRQVGEKKSPASSSPAPPLSSPADRNSRQGGYHQK